MAIPMLADTQRHIARPKAVYLLPPLMLGGAIVAKDFAVVRWPLYRQDPARGAAYARNDSYQYRCFQAAGLSDGPARSRFTSVPPKFAIDLSSLTTAGFPAASRCPARPYRISYRFLLKIHLLRADGDPSSACE